LVLIPIGFNIEPVDLQQLINAESLQQVEETEETLELTLRELSEYRCPYCNSPQSASGSIPLTEHDDGYYQVFECGYRMIDGFDEYLCPKDPKFPAIDDFELLTHQTSNGEWICYANSAPPTSAIRWLSLAHLHRARAGCASASR